MFKLGLITNAGGSIQKDIEDIKIVLYTVQEKDTIASVAEKFNVSSIDIIFANQLYNSQTLYTGQVCSNIPYIDISPSPNICDYILYPSRHTIIYSCHLSIYHSNF